MPPADALPTPRAVVEPFVDEGLGNSAYLVSSPTAKVAVVIDPMRDIDGYVAAASRDGVRIAHVLETHLHNDFVSGARELAAATGAVIGASAEAQLEFEHRALKDGDRIALGEAALQVVATPGHTPEHVSYLLVEPQTGTPGAVFTGGALIVGGAARTDLLGGDLTVPLARRLYHTVHSRLLTLPDAVEVLPTHGAGSFCAVPMAEERTTTIGRERETNPLCRARGEDEFVALATADLFSYPAYFRELRPVNRHGPRVLAGPLRLEPRTPATVQSQAASGAAVLDVRSAAAFAEGHVPSAYGIAVDAPLTTWAGWLIPFRSPILLVSGGAGDRDEAVRQLLRIGYDDLRGYLVDGMKGWTAAGLAVERILRIGPADLRARLAAGTGPVVVDVRTDGEWEAGHIPGAVHVENGLLATQDLGLPFDTPIVVHCQSRNRSTSGWSVLARRGYRNLAVLDGGFRAWNALRFEVEK